MIIIINYNMPWEYDADIRGEVNREHAKWAHIVHKWYWKEGNL